MRFQWIDSLKGGAMIMVIATHSSCSTVFPKLSVILTAGYMAIFFILSGCTTKNEELGLAIKKKAMRLLIPYFFYGITITFLFSILHILFNSSININEWIGLLYSRYAIYRLNHPDNIFLLHTTAPLWFLTAMFISYIWFYIYRELKDILKRCVCVMLFITATIILQNTEILLPWSIDTSFLCALFIIIGHEFSSYATKIHKKGFIYFTILLVLLCAYLVIVTYNGNANLSIGFYGNLGTLSIFLYFILSIIITILYGELLKMFDNSFISIFLAFVGRHSLRLMCIHLPIIVLLNYFTRFVVVGKFATFIITFIISLTISIVIEKIRNRYVVKYPILKYL